jgi:hypothetical protein
MIITHLYIIAFLWLPDNAPRRFPALVPYVGPPVTKHATAAISTMSNNATVDTNGTVTGTVTASSMNASTTVPIVKHKRKPRAIKPKVPKERPIEIKKVIKKVQVYKPRPKTPEPIVTSTAVNDSPNELSHEQLAQIHEEINNEMTQSHVDKMKEHNEYYISLSAKLETLSEHVAELIKRDRHVQDQVVFLDDAVSPHTLYNPEVKSHLKNSKYRMVSKAESAKVAETLMKQRKLAKAQKEGTVIYRDKSINADTVQLDIVIKALKEEKSLVALYGVTNEDQFKNMIYDPLQEEFETLIQQYREGDIGIPDFEYVLESNGVNITDHLSKDHRVKAAIEKDSKKQASKRKPAAQNRNTRNSNSRSRGRGGKQVVEEVEDAVVDICNLEYLTIDDVEAIEDEKIGINDANSDEDGDEDDGADDVSSMYATKEDLSDLVTLRTNEITNFYRTAKSLPIQKSSLSALERELVGKLDDDYKAARTEVSTRFQELWNQVDEFRQLVETIKTNSKQGLVAKPDIVCVDEDDVRFMMKPALELIMRKGMDINDAMQLLLPGLEENSDKDDDDEKEQITLDKLPTLLSPENMDNPRREQKLNQLMNTPMVPYSIRALDECIEMITGYSGALDKAIDFVSGLHHRNEEEECSMGKTIEAGLIHLFKKAPIPDRLVEMKKKAGILLQQ